MPRLEPESTISHYKIKELIASGGMGEVYRAIDLQLGRVVALKTILSIKADDPDAHRRFLREARSASILSHPSICTIYEIAQEGDLTFIAMQYIPGRTLEEILSQEQLPIETILGYTLDITDALDEAHRNGVVHRDIKPSNIIANGRDIAVVLDFGLAKQLSFAGAPDEDMLTLANLTAATTLLGTAPYMPPEEIRGESLDERSDIFSLGVTLYEMLSGVRPFDRPNKVEVLHAILHDEPKPISKLRADVDLRLGGIVGKALEKDRSKRYQSASEFKQEILAYVQESGFQVRGFQSSSASGKFTPVRSNELPRPKGKFTSSRVFYSGLVLAFVIVVVIAGTIWWLVKNRSKPDSELLLSLRHVELVSWKSEPGESDIFSSLSRDGTMIAYSLIRGGYPNIWIKQTMSGNSIQVTSDEWRNQNPIWSFDNQEIAFVSRRGNQTGIWRTPALGGTPKLVGALTVYNPQLKYWSKDGGTIYYESSPNLFTLNVVSGQTTQITSFEPHNDDPNFSISPQEDRIAYVDRQDGQLDIWVMPMRGGPPVRVTNDSARDRNPVWLADGQRIVYSSLRDGVYQICVAYLDGRKPLQITSGDTDKLVSDVSATGARILYGIAKEESDIWGVKVESREEFEVTSDIGSELWPDASPDNKTIAFQATRQSIQDRELNDSLIMIKQVQTGAQPTQVATGSDPKWSPDGSKLALVRDSNQYRNIWVVKVAGGGEKQITSGGISDSGHTLMPYNRKQARDFSWSSDSQKLIYCADRPPDKSTVSIVSADGSGEARIIRDTTSESFYSPLWSPDGKHAIYLSQARTKSADGKIIWQLWLTEIETGKSEAAFQRDSVLRLLGWAIAGNDAIVATVEGKTSSPTAADVDLFHVVTAGGSSRPFATLKSAYLYNIQLSPDGRTIAFASHQDGRDNIWLIPALGGTVRKITANADPQLYFSSLTWSTDGKTIYYGKQSRYSLISAVDNFR
jgi:serine/threonine protein kinase